MSDSAAVLSSYIYVCYSGCLFAQWHYLHIFNHRAPGDHSKKNRILSFSFVFSVYPSSHRFSRKNFVYFRRATYSDGPLDIAFIRFLILMQTTALHIFADFFHVFCKFSVAGMTRTSTKTHSLIKFIC